MFYMLYIAFNFFYCDGLEAEVLGGDNELVLADEFNRAFLPMLDDLVDFCYCCENVPWYLITRSGFSEHAQLAAKLAGKVIDALVHVLVGKECVHALSEREVEVLDDDHEQLAVGHYGVCDIREMVCCLESTVCLVDERWKFSHMVSR